MATGLLGAVAGSVQNQVHHEKELRLAADLKEAEMHQAQRFHVGEMRQSAELFKTHATTQWQLHHDTMGIARDLARRETMRDVWQQRQFLNQTLLVVAALMFSSVFVAISQPQLPEPESPNAWYYGLYGIALGLSAFLLALSMWATFKVQSRMGSYNVNTPRLVYRCGNPHADFNSYFSCHCEWLRVVATAAFFSGTMALLAGSVGAQLVQAEHHFKDPLTGYIFAAVVVVSAIFVIATELFASDKCVEGPEYGGLAHTDDSDSASEDGVDVNATVAKQPTRPVPK